MLFVTPATGFLPRQDKWEIHIPRQGSKTSKSWGLQPGHLVETDLEKTLTSTSEAGVGAEAPPRNNRDSGMDRGNASFWGARLTVHCVEVLAEVIDGPDWSLFDSPVSAVALVAQRSSSEYSCVRSPGVLRFCPRGRTSVTANTRIQFDYKPFWAPDAERRAPVHITLDTFAADDLIATEIREAGTFFEIELLEHLAIRGPWGGVFVDVGANIGNHAVFFGKFLAERVVCVEPHPDLTAILSRNLDINAIAGAAVLPVAAGHRAGAAYISRAKALIHKNIAATQLEKVRPDDGVEVQISPLDALVDGLRPSFAGRRITCVKIDVEGLELDVLRGATEILQNDRPQLVIELASREARAAVKRFLAEFGYDQIGQRFGWAPTYHFIDPHVHRLRDSLHVPTPDASADRMRAIEAELAALIPPGGRFILVDQAEIVHGLALDDRTWWPFLERDGQYWGPPADDATAITELERLHDAGAQFMVFTRCGFWWLDYYRGFADYLRAHAERLAASARLIVFRLET
jgi:FkbM family methyltransferase